MRARANITRDDLQPSRDLCVTILLLKEYFTAIVGRKHEFLDLNLTPSEVEGLNASLNYSSKALVSHLRSGVQIPDLPKLLLDPSEGLAAQGHAALNALFGTHLPRLRYLLEDIKGIPIIELRSNEFFLPWELLYDQPPQDVGSDLGFAAVMAPFWAVNRIVTRQKLNTTHRPQRPLKAPVRIGLAINDELAFAREERVYLEKLSAEGVIRLTEFKPKPTWDPWRFIAEFGEFMGNEEIDIFHFACHADWISTDSRRSYLDFGGGFRYQVSFFDQSPPVQLAGPLVFLNACSTGVRKPLHTYDFVQSFWKRGATDVIAIECAIESQVAETYASEFYSAFLGGMPLGEAVLDARRSIISGATRGPEVVAVFYALYAAPELRINHL